MARKRKSGYDGPPGVKVGGSIGPALNPITLTDRARMPYGNFLDPNVALEQVPHPSAKWAGIELQPIKPRE